ncbi:MAG: hypothetical protein MZW92_35135 [Comamonadaceae bacterium]|nr:hypothetical protein [Comamonadaceae bacterium]
MAVAVVAAVLLASAMLAGVGEVFWMRHARHHSSSPTAQAQAVIGDFRQ